MQRRTLIRNLALGAAGVAVAAPAVHGAETVSLADGDKLDAGPGRAAG